MKDLTLLARVLQEARKRLGMSVKDLAARSGYSISKIEKTEAGLLPVTEDYLAAVVPVLASAWTEPKELVAMLEAMRQDGLNRPTFSEWFRAWVEIEQQADTLRVYEPDLIPGLLQTPQYAMALLGSEEAVAARIQRQECLDQADVTVIIGEHVLRWAIGSPKVMEEQLAHLTSASATVHILPEDAQTNLGRDGSFALATLGDRRYVYVETPARSFTLEDREIVSRIAHTWDVLRGEALPQRLSQRLIMEVAETWKQ
jgi:transcriptional regulator with XRE-family HTH domain